MMIPKDHGHAFTVALASKFLLMCELFICEVLASRLSRTSSRSRVKGIIPGRDADYLTTTCKTLR
eukprot:2010785-Pleurochrysis_carterae.AAC.3